MRRAIAADFAAVPGVRVLTTVDARLGPEARPGVDVRVISDQQTGWFPSLVSEADCTVLIAPESDSILARWSGMIQHFGGHVLGSSERAVEFTGDKFRLGRHFESHHVPTPPTWTLEPRLFGLPGEWSGPIIVKPRFGAGSIDTIVIRDRQCPPWATPRRNFVAQPYQLGTPMSASFLVDSSGRATLIGIGRQRIEEDEQGRIRYLGGEIDPRSQDCPTAVFQAIQSLASRHPRYDLRGFIGVDFLLDAEGRATVLEINPRPTTSYVGLARLLPPGTIAAAWLASADGPLAATDWPDRLRLDPNVPPTIFDADGTIHPRPGVDDR